MRNNACMLLQGDNASSLVVEYVAKSPGWRRSVAVRILPRDAVGRKAALRCSELGFYPCELRSYWVGGAARPLRVLGPSFWVGRCCVADKPPRESRHGRSRPTSVLVHERSDQRSYLYDSRFDKPIFPLVRSGSRMVIGSTQRALEVDDPTGRFRRDYFQT